MSAQDPTLELRDLAAVHEYYTNILEERLGFPVPKPENVVTPSLENAQISDTVRVLCRWLSLLDMAIAPVVVRDTMKESSQIKTSEALLRYLMRKQNRSTADRDKTDCVVSFLFRQSSYWPAVEQNAVSNDPYYFIAENTRKFAADLARMLGENKIPALPNQYAQLLREFEFLYGDVEDFRTFDQLMDSGIITRVRDIKQSFSDYFYHPEVLATVSVYNAVFGRKFDELFHITTEQLKSFAEKVQKDGASMMSRLEGDILVKNLAEVEEDRILQEDYQNAQEDFRKISRLKKAMDNRKGRPTIPAPSPGTRTAPGRGEEKPQAPKPATARPAAFVALDASQGAEGMSTADFVTSNSEAAEEGKISAQLDYMRSFVRAGNPTSCVIPLVKGVIEITPAEAEALRTDYKGEKSFRADYVNALSHLAAMLATLVVEQEYFQAKRGSAYLWKPHADSMTYIMNKSKGLKTANEVMAVADSRGLADKVEALKASIMNVRVEMHKAAALLQNLGG